MKIRLSELRRLIREVVGGDDLALLVTRPNPGKVMVYLYSPSGVEDNLGDVVASVENGRDGAGVTGVIVGMAGYGKPTGPCHGAWGVTSIAGVGYGRILYGLGYNLTPNGRLMPDRFDNTPMAVAAWSKAARKLKKVPFDEEDCDLVLPRSKGGPDPLLDAAYEGGGLPDQEIAKMRVRHADVVRLLGTVGVSEDDWKDWLRRKGMEFFATSRIKGSGGAY